ncbi:MAG TPA: DUF2336 domain-containing protein [Xanthobacteraceae bacterium]|nr:DUF2336 domain-containing protein [Xanthobacteraceae bacterium]
MAGQSNAVMAELEAALGPSASPRTFEIMRKITDLFVEGVESYTVNQIDFFDDVICRLIEHNGPQGAVEVSAKLAPCEKAPAKVVRKLSSDNNLAVSGPFLRGRFTLPDSDLVQFVRTKRKEYLALVASRPELSAAVTDVLIERGDRDIMRILLTNPGAKISDGGFAKLISEGRTSKEFTQLIEQRKDLPDELKPFVEMNLRKFEKK